MVGERIIHFRVNLLVVKRVPSGVGKMMSLQIFVGL